MKRKIFCIGLPKTGQVSLAYAMKTLGYQVNFYPYSLRVIRKKDFVMDLPVLLRYKELDKIFPGSKFIMTTRDYNSWINSFRNHYRRFPASRRHKALLKYRQRFWDTVHFDTYTMTRRYYEHQAYVYNYFKDRRKDLLVFNIVDGEGWKKLCPFLGKKVPRIPFPKENVGKYRKLTVYKKKK